MLGVFVVLILPMVSAEVRKHANYHNQPINEMVVSHTPDDLRHPTKADQPKTYRVLKGAPRSMDHILVTSDSKSTQKVPLQTDATQL